MFQFLILILSMALLAGCVTTPHCQRVTGDSSRVQLLGFESCPNTPVLSERLRVALAHLDAVERIEQIDQERLADSDLRRGWPAPTVLINGHDLFGMPSPKSPALGCRMYTGPGGVPSIEELARRLKDAGIGQGGQNE